MSSGERPIGAAKGKQSDTEALCQTPPPPHRLTHWVLQPTAPSIAQASVAQWGHQIPHGTGVTADQYVRLIL